MMDDTPQGWRERLGRFAGDLRAEIERAGKSVGIGDDDRPYEIAPYRGYGTPSRVLVHGRVIESRKIAPATESDTLWRNLINTYKRIDSDPLPRARVQVRVGDVERELVADDEGFFREWIDLASPIASSDGWHDADVALRAPREGHPEVRANVPIRLPLGTETFGVISDLDDTVIQSRITSFLQAVRTVMLGNARTRLPFPGVAAFYRALERGGDGERRNPIFYVSSSPWNIYDVIAEFMDIQKIPRGPLILRDWDISWNALMASRHADHKSAAIRNIFALHPEMQFILIGDSSQQDPEIYQRVVAEFPNRVKGIYIRDVTLSAERSASVKKLADEVLTAGSTLVLVEHTLDAAKHAAAQGWIDAAALPEIGEEKRADEGRDESKAPAPAGGEPGPGKPPVVVGASATFDHTPG
jgi:phosphatidate phosphatase APP1